jgi:hypothetical protein
LTTLGQVRDERPVRVTAASKNLGNEVEVQDLAVGDLVVGLVEADDLHNLLPEILEVLLVEGVLPETTRGDLEDEAQCVVLALGPLGDSLLELGVDALPQCFDWATGEAPALWRPSPWRAQPPTVAERLVAADVSCCPWCTASPPACFNRRDKLGGLRRAELREARWQPIVDERGHRRLGLLQPQHRVLRRRFEQYIPMARIILAAVAQ